MRLVEIQTDRSRMTCDRRAVVGRAWRTAIILFAAARVAAGDQTVTVGPDLAFSPVTVTVVPGEAVIWVFQALHTSTSEALTGPEVWNSGLQSSGTFSHTFQTPGTYSYYCALHSFPGGTMMNGVVSVKGAGATPTPTAVPPTLTATPPPTAVATPSPLPTSVPGPAAAGIPLLDAVSLVLLAVALGAAGIVALSLGGRR